MLPVPVGRVVPPADGPALLRAAAGLDGFDWVVLTSPNGVAALAEALGELGGGGFPASPPPRLCAVGPGTGERCEELLGRSPDLVPSASIGEGIVQSFSEMAQDGGLGGGRVLVLQGDAARRVVLEGLRGLGFLATGVVAYRNLPDREALPAFVAAVQGGGVDLLVLTAGSAARRVGMALREGGVDGFPPVVCMGPAASVVAEQEGFPVVGVAHPHTAEGVVQACARFWGGDGGAARR